MGVRKPWLWFSSLSIEVQKVTSRHTTTCCVCGQLPDGLRLQVRSGAGRSAKSRVYCVAHALALLRRMKDEAARAGDVLQGWEIPIRLSPEDYEWQGRTEEFKAFKNPPRKEEGKGVRVGAYGALTSPTERQSRPRRR
jgi:hypothetical protein